MSLALLVTGATGQLGSELLRAVAGWRDCFARGLTRAELDITDRVAVEHVVGTWGRVLRSDSSDHRLVVLNTAAYTAVDAAEQDEAAAYAVNAVGPALLAAACARVGARLIQLSTDYVFDGARPTARAYEVDDPTGPRSAYGRTKLAGERAVLTLLPAAGYVVRTSWLYGGPGPHFVATMRRLEAERDTVDVVADQSGSPTWARDLAGGLRALAASGVPAGIYHCTGAGATSWYGLARAVFQELGADPERVRATTTAAFPRPAPRPAYSVLSPAGWAAAGLPLLPAWRESVAAYLSAGRGVGAERPSVRPTAVPSSAPASTSEG